ncbi:hypothetical protein [Methanolobus sp.]|uniref:hypothetical protein n=1 Tax=Methanolobus sp. TaxID=1874737 RepID=UPI0025D24A7E|nr:hypothetical protein [Methanolobus sp.]
MEILIPDIVDTALISGVISLFLIADILVKNYLKINLRDVGADLAIGALVIQLAFVATLLKGQQMDFFWNNLVLVICFAIFWYTSLWLAGKRDSLTDMFSYTIGTFALASSIMHFLGTFRSAGMILLLSYSFILSVLSFFLAEYLRKETAISGYDKFTKNLQIYDVNENYRKLESGKGNLDPLQPMVDIIRGAIRNKNLFVATVGIKRIPELCANVLVSSGNKALIIKHLNTHLYHLAILAEDEKDRFTLMEVIDAFGSVGKQCAEADIENFTLNTIDSMTSFFEIYKEKEHFTPLDKLSLIRHSKNLKDINHIVTNKMVTTPLHELAIATGHIGIATAKKDMLEPTEKSVILLKKIALDAASNADASTMENVRIVLLEFARTVDSKKQDHLKKLIIYALRDIGIKTVHESPDLKKHDCLDKVIETLKEVGEIFGEDSILDATAALKDIGVAAARKHSDEKVSRVIPVIEHFCTVAAENKYEDQASSAVNAMLEVCEISIREQMVESTASSSKSFANLSNIESISIFVNEAVFEIGKYKEVDREMFALFDKTYRKSGGR